MSNTKQAKRSSRPSLDETARSAYAEARLLQPSWQSMARVMTRNPKMRVDLVASGRSETDGKTFIRICVPLELANLGPHDGRCKERDELKLIKCNRCQQTELANIIVIHEISHIVEQTFEAVSLKERAAIIRRAIDSECEGKDHTSRAIKLRAKIDNAPEVNKQDYLNLLHLVSPYLSMLFNAAEDVRVNRLMQETRPGTKVMFEAMTNMIFVKGIKKHGGEVFHWRDAEPNAQAMIGVYCKVSGFDYATWLSEKIVEDLEDAELTAICEEMKKAPTARAMYRLTYPLLECFRRLGYFKAPDEPEDDAPPPPPPPDEDEQDEEEQPSQGDSPEADTSDSDDGNDADEGEQGDGDDPDNKENEDDEGTGEGSDSRESDKNDGLDDSGRDGEPSPDVDDQGDDEDVESPDGDSDPESPSGGDSSDDDGLEETSGLGEVGPDDEDSSDNPGELSPEVDEQGDSDGDSDAEAGADPADDQGTGEDQGEPDSEPGDTDTGDEAEGDEGASPDDVGDDSTDGSGDEGETEDSDASDSEGDDADSDSAEDSDVDGEGDGAESTSSGPADDPSDGHDSSQDGAGQPASADEGTDSQDDPSGDPSDLKDTQEAAPEPYTEADQEAAGTPDVVQELLNIFGGHSDLNEDDEGDQPAYEPGEEEPGEGGEQVAPQSEIDRAMLVDALERAIEQLDVFDAPSMNIMGIKKTRREDWTDEHYGPWHELRSGSDVPVISEAILTSALQRLRLAFQDNMKASYDRNLKSGRVDRRALGKRIATNDPRLFHRKSIPSKKDYFVVVGADCSGSTSRALHPGDRSVRIIDLIKEATFAKCELLNRLGIKFAVYGHSGDSGYCAIYEVKSPEEPWGKKQKESLATLQPTSANLDGHTMEFYRKVAQVRPETDKIILYYTDGAMPLSNFDEELAILQREIKMCQRLGIAIVGVGIRNDDPKAHGLDTIRLDAIEDVPKVVTELRKRLLSTLIPN